MTFWISEWSCAGTFGCSEDDGYVVELLPTAFLQSSLIPNWYGAIFQSGRWRKLLRCRVAFGSAGVLRSQANVLKLPSWPHQGSLLREVDNLLLPHYVEGFQVNLLPIFRHLHSRIPPLAVLVRGNNMKLFVGAHLTSVQNGLETR